MLRHGSGWAGTGPSRSARSGGPDPRDDRPVSGLWESPWLLPR